MGNQPSKKALLVAANQRATAIQSDLDARERALAQIQQSLETEKVEKTTASSEAAKLRQLVQDLDKQYAAVDEERRREIERLVNQVKQKGNETVAQQHVSKLRTQERDEARKVLKDLEEKVEKLVEQRNARAGEVMDRIEILEAERKKQNEDMLARAEEQQKLAEQKEAQLHDARTEAQSLTQKLAQLQENQRLLAEELAQAKADAARGIEQERRTAAEALAKVKADAAAAAAAVAAASSTPASVTTAAVANAQAKQLGATRALAVRIWNLAKVDQKQTTSLASPSAAHLRVKTSSSSLRPHHIHRVPTNGSEPGTPTPALTASPSSSPERGNASPMSTSGILDGPRDFTKPVRFSLYPRIGKDLRVEVGENDEEVMIEIREWHRGVRSFKGISIPVGDAGELVKILPEVVRHAEMKEDQILKSDLQREQDIASNPASPAAKFEVVASHTPVEVKIIEA